MLALVGLQGFAGPMGPIDKPYLPFGHGQADLMLEWLGLQYADLYLMHEGDLGSTGATLLNHSSTTYSLTPHLLTYSRCFVACSLLTRKFHPRPSHLSLTSLDIIN